MGLLVLVRHGQSEWNARKIFSGQGNPDLTQQGIAEARRTGGLLKSQSIQFDLAYSSGLTRARKTLDLILSETGHTHLHVNEDNLLFERDYGELTGVTMQDACRKHGEEQVRQWRQSLYAVPPGGESLEMAASRASGMFTQSVLPHLSAGKNVIISSHRNTLRGLISKICKLDQAETERLHIETAQPLYFQAKSATEIEPLLTKKAALKPPQHSLFTEARA
ncbi:2,3-bisphosphoglycerate-dependent phosphoglycerate mutase [Pseudovibrio axinellae]|uniref:2,3-bisphosphoglycerate-dependent phosphoglycerate mutase n=1 Tax=Pseudovibrio axinellae TaxID=989403 RepID=A0A165Z8W9_9HYPH|nr:2,3-bisphosphoglycerate-dependent phosphoglycerate mutase [Pseudovibrio axinellae]KZL19612.1 2,3-bisphosphoglycerate-dependent phosphoglycerate mutase [Pseudovibrio axinellae]SEQ34181.1 2,3-bisphosphoglycerate-dependent phosphoglycerate mutase [Pseudovibrio axinellae]